MPLLPVPPGSCALGWIRPLAGQSILIASTRTLALSAATTILEGTSSPRDARSVIDARGLLLRGRASRLTVKLSASCESAHAYAVLAQ